MTAGCPSPAAATATPLRLLVLACGFVTSASASPWWQYDEPVNSGSATVDPYQSRGRSAVSALSARSDASYESSPSFENEALAGGLVEALRTSPYTNEIDRDDNYYQAKR